MEKLTSTLALALSLLSFPSLLHAADLKLPLQPDEAKIIQAIATTEGVEVALAPKPGFSARGAAETLVSLGVPKDAIGSVTIQTVGQEARALTVTHDKAGHVLAITGNGPWLRNSTLRSFKALSELRILRMDHNGFVGKDLRIPEFDGSGFVALVDSKLADIKIGLSFSNKGMEQCAKIKSLRSFGVGHSKVTDAGLNFFEGHPSLESFSVAEMGNVSQAALASIAKMPKVTHVGFQEAFVTYEGGFKHLLPMKGRLKTLDLTMSVVNDADLKQVQADHPDTRIVTIPPAEIVKRHSFIANRLARIATGEAAEKLKKAIAEYQPKKK